MPTRLKDMRAGIKDIDEADRVFAEIARAEIALAKARAQAESKIATIKKNLESECEPVERELAGNRASLSLYIETHPEQFEKPRKRKTSWGHYGLQKASRVEIFDPVAAIEYSIKHVLGCTKTVLDLPAARKLVKDGQEIAGCELCEGDIAHYTVAKSLLDEAGKD